MKNEKNLAKKLRSERIEAEKVAKNATDGYINYRNYGGRNLASLRRQFLSRRRNG